MSCLLISHDLKEIRQTLGNDQISLKEKMPALQSFAKINQPFSLWSVPRKVSLRYFVYSELKPWGDALSDKRTVPLTHKDFRLRNWDKKSLTRQYDFQFLLYLYLSMSHSRSRATHLTPEFLLRRDLAKKFRDFRYTHNSIAAGEYIDVDSRNFHWSTYLDLTLYLEAVCIYIDIL